MEHDQMLPECTVEFTQINKNQAILERKLDKALEKIGQVATDMAVTRVTVENHQGALQASMDKQREDADKQEERFQQSIGRVWKVVLVLIGGAGVGGAGAVVNQMVF